MPNLYKIYIEDIKFWLVNQEKNKPNKIRLLGPEPMGPKIKNSNQNS